MQISRGEILEFIQVGYVGWAKNFADQQR